MTLIFYKILTLLSEDLKVPLIRIVFFFFVGIQDRLVDLEFFRLEQNSNI